MAFIDPLLDLFLPSNCAECKTPPSVYCPDCLNRHSAHTFERFDLPSLTKISGLALTYLDEKVSGAMSAFKEQNQFAIARSMVDALLPANPFGSIDDVVGAPSAKASFKKRGFVPAELVATRIARRWGLPRATSALRFVREVEDQASLSVDERRANLVNSMVAAPRLLGRRVLIVDDIVTTGSTMVEAARATVAAGATVVGFAALAETQKRHTSWGPYPSGHPAVSQVGPEPSPKID